ncbi:MAG: cation transporter [Elusimicrobia bacterium]|nr:MAG: cation transporter [Gammaproteobacteria bacterium]TXH27598.1 MAG: cation transporter [Elusimicrobiota bacterium]
MTHDHAHHAGDHHDHHPHAPEASRSRKLLFAFALTSITLFVEAVGGWISGSLALLADAGHMLVDASALLFAWLGAWFARKPADALRSFGYARLEVLVGYTNALTQLLLVAWIAYEAISRLFEPAPILSGTMLLVACIGLLVNLVVLRVLGGHEHDDLNTAAARLHVIGDLLGSLGAVTAALVVRYLDWLWADPAISLLVSALILRSAWHLLRRSAHILLEGVPEGFDVEALNRRLEAGVEGICGVHHLHVWQLAGGRRMATLHAQLVDGSNTDAVLARLQSLLRHEFGISHATIQVESAACPQAHCCD